MRPIDRRIPVIFRLWPNGELSLPLDAKIRKVSPPIHGIYTTYELDQVSGGKKKTERGVATEVFVRQGERWLNTGWQLAPRPSPGTPRLP